MIKRNSARDFAIFKTFDEYQAEYNDGPHVDDQTICFVSNTGKIYTHGDEFGGKGATYTGEDGININSSNVISIDTDWLRNQNLGGGTTYTSADSYINVDNIVNKISLNVSTLEAKLEDDGFKGSGGVTNVNNYYYTGITADFNSDSIVVVKKENGKNPEIETSPTLNAYLQEDGTLIDINTIEVESIVDGNGITHNDDEAIQVSPNGQIVTIRIQEDAFDMNMLGGTLTFTFKVKATVTNVDMYGIATYKIYSLDTNGEFIGKNGISWKIVVPAAVTADVNNNNIISPEAIEPYIEICTSVGVNVDNISENTSKIYATDLSDGSYRLCYKFDNGEWFQIDNDGDNSFLTNYEGQPRAQKTIYVALVKVDDTNKPYVGLLQIPVVLTGKNGLNATGIDYQIQPVMSNVSKKYSNDQENPQPYTEGYIKVKIFKSTNGNREELTGNITDNYAKRLLCFIGDVLLGEFQYSETSGAYEFHVEQEGFSEDAAYMQVLLTDTTLNTRLAAIIIPIRIDGERGADGTTTIVHEYEVQSLDFPVMRMRGSWETDPNPAYNNGTVNEDGVWYTDVVEYCGCYFRCTVAGITNAPCKTSGEGTAIYENGSLATNIGWEAFSYSPAIITDYLIANQAFIKSLAAKQIVIENDNNNIVAGMASGKYIASTESGLSDTSANGVRIWAGPLGSGGNVAAAPFTVDEQGLVKMITALLGNGAGLHMKITGNSICFYNSTDCIARFITEGAGLQLEIKGPSGVWYKIDFLNWTRIGSVHTAYLYNLHASSSNGAADTITVYYTGDKDVFYEDSEGTIRLTRRSYYEAINHVYIIDNAVDPTSLVYATVYKPVIIENGHLSDDVSRQYCIVVDDDQSNNNNMYVSATASLGQILSPNDLLYMNGSKLSTQEYNSEVFHDNYRIQPAEVVSSFANNVTGFTGEITEVHIDIDGYFVAETVEY